MKLKNPFWLDTTELAKAQDSVIRGEKPASSLVPFEPLCKIQEGLNGVTNLTIRQDWLMGRPNASHYGEEELMVGGRYWAEGPSYMEYTGLAIVGPDHARRLMLERYNPLIAPDGTIPVPESSAQVYPIPLEQEDYHCDSTYLVKRWRDEQGVYGYLLVCIDPVLRHTQNLHTHPTPGHFVLFVNGEWKAAPHRYVSFNYDDVFHEIDRLNLPKGAFKPIAWRLKPPQTWIGVKPGRVEVRYEGFFAPKRVIEFGSDYVRVTDSWFWKKNKVQEWAVKR